MSHKLADHPLELIVAKCGDAIKLDVADHELDVCRLHDISDGARTDHWRRYDS